MYQCHFSCMQGGGDKSDVISPSPASKTFNCPTCASSFKSSQTLNFHKKKYGSTCLSMKKHEVFPKVCSLCQHSFSTRVKFNNHTRYCNNKSLLESDKLLQTSHAVNMHQNIGTLTLSRIPHPPKINESTAQYNPSSVVIPLAVPTFNVSPLIETFIPSPAGTSYPLTSTSDYNIVNPAPNVHENLIEVDSSLKWMRVSDDKVQTSFQSEDAFRDWLYEFEKRTRSCFTAKNGAKETKISFLRYLTCQFDAKSNSHRKVGERRRLSVRQRGCGMLPHLNCPSKISMNTCKVTQTVTVTVNPNHNHECTAYDFQYQPLNAKKRNEILSLLKKNVSPQDIYEKLFPDKYRVKNVRKGELPIPTCKEETITLRYIKQLKYKIMLESSCKKDDAASVYDIVQEFHKEECDPILLYKPNGQGVVIGNKDLDSPCRKDQFTLAIQTEWQREMMERYGVEQISFDSTHGSNQYKYQLHSWVVKGKFGNGIPVMHVITSCEDTLTFASIYKEIKKKSPTFCPRSTMSDDDKATHPAIKQVFGSQVRRLLCKWHILRSFQKNLCRVPNSYKKSVYTHVIAMLEEISVEKFKRQADGFKMKFVESCPDFFQYFNSNYLNRPEEWAMAFRNFPHCGNDYNMFCESLHNKIKNHTAFGNKKVMKRVDKLIDLLFKLQEYSLKDYQEAQFKKKIPNSHKYKARHDRGIAIPDTDVNVLAANNWLIKSQTKLNAASDEYFLLKISDKCCNDHCFDACLEPVCVDLCVHLYKCDCKDISGMCKHIHKIHAMFCSDIILESSMKYFSHAVETTIVQPNTNEVLAVVGLDTQPYDIKALTSKACELVLPTDVEKTRTINAPNPVSFVPSRKYMPNEKPKLQVVSFYKPPKKKLKSHQEHPDFQAIKLAQQELVSLGTSVKGEVVCTSEYDIEDKIVWPQPERIELLDQKQLLTQAPSAAPSSAETPCRDSAPLEIAVAVQGNRYTPVITDDTEDWKFSVLVAQTSCKLYELRLPDIETLDTAISDKEIKIIRKKCRPTFNRGWLTDNIIDCYLYKCCLNKPVFDFFSCVQVQNMLYPVNIARRVIRKSLVRLSDVIFLPINLQDGNGVGRHWTMLVCYPKKHMFQYLDPLHDRAPDIPDFVLKKVIDYLGTTPQCSEVDVAENNQQSKHICTCGKPWIITYPLVLKQQDQMSCGVFICHYAKMRIMGCSFEEMFDVNKFRAAMYNYLLFS